MQRAMKLCCLIPAMLAGLSLYAQVTYRLAPTSGIEISGTSTMSDWVVRSQKLSGEMIFAPDEKTATGSTRPHGNIKEAKIILEVSDIKSEKGETMDNKMYRALKHDSHPQITFVLTQPVLVQKQDGKISAPGKVSLAGVTQPMTFDLSRVSKDNTFHFQGSRSLKLSDFEIEPPTAMFGQIVTGDEIVVKLNLVFGKQEE
jgi:polyisoprenoid-binding protein YceI